MVFPPVHLQPDRDSAGSKPETLADPVSPGVTGAGRLRLAIVLYVRTHPTHSDGLPVFEGVLISLRCPCSQYTSAVSGSIRSAAPLRRASHCSLANWLGRGHMPSALSPKRRSSSAASCGCRPRSNFRLRVRANSRSFSCLQKVRAPSKITVADQRARNARTLAQPIATPQQCDNYLPHHPSGEAEVGLGKTHDLVNDV